MKKFLSLILLFLLILPVMAQSRKKVAVVLSGGGAKGVAHIRALKVIEEAGIPIDYVVGTSMGSIIGGLYSIGYTPEQLDSMVSKQDWLFLLSDKVKRSDKSFTEKEKDETYVLTIPFKKKPKDVSLGGIIKGQNLDNLFTDLTIGYHDSIDFNKLPIPFACVAVDLVKGEEIVFHNGELPIAMRASMAIPAVFTPVRKNGMILVDGGLRNNFPVDIAKEMGADLVIGVDVQATLKTEEEIKSVTDMLSQIIDITSQAKYKKNLKQTDVYIKVDITGYSAGSFSKVAIDTLMNRGEIAARKEWDELKKLKQKIGIADDFKAPQHGPYSIISENKPLFIHSISFSGLDEEDRLWMIKKCKLQENSEVSMEQLQYALTEIYGTQAYSNISYKLSKEKEGYNLQFLLQEKHDNSFNLGLRFDSEEVASVMVHGSYQLNTRIASKVEVTGRLGKRTSARLDYILLPAPLRSLNFSYMYQYNDINIYNHGSREYNTTFSYHLGEIGYSNVIKNNLKTGIGARYEHYNYKNFLFNHNGDNLDVKPEGFISYFAFVYYETLDKRYFPSRGTRLKADYSLCTDNGATYNEHAPFSALSAQWTTVFSVSNRFALLPSIYGRVLIGRDVPYPFLNAMGGDMFGRYTSQQLPFAGIGFMEVFENSLMVARLQLRQRMGNNHYISLTGNYALNDRKFEKLLKGKQIYGGSIGYGYNSMFGPLELSFNLSNQTDKLGFYLNLGFMF